jgi:hypothetical protein
LKLETLEEKGRKENRKKARFENVKKEDLEKLKAYLESHQYLSSQ